MPLELYTFIMDYNGGTYVSQVQSNSLLEAPLIWAQTLDVRNVLGLGPASKRQLLEEVRNGDKKPVQLSGMISVWCISVLLRGKLALVNFVKTKDDGIG